MQQYWVMKSILLLKLFQFRFKWINDIVLSYKQQRRMTSQNIFIEQQKWNRYSHPLTHLQQLQRTSNSQAIKNYFTQRTLSGYILKHISDNQIHKADSHIKSAKIKAIYKDKSKCLKKKSQMNQKPSLDVKFSSRTNVCEEQQQEVSQYLSNWEEGIMLA